MCFSEIHLVFLSFFCNHSFRKHYNLHEMQKKCCGALLMSPRAIHLYASCPIKLTGGEDKSRSFFVSKGSLDFRWRCFSWWQEKWVASPALYWQTLLFLAHTKKDSLIFKFILNAEFSCRTEDLKNFKNIFRLILCRDTHPQDTTR